MAITNRSVISESPVQAIPGANHSASRMTNSRALVPCSNALDDSSFLGSQFGDEPQQAYRKIRERLIELEIEKEEQEKQLDLIKQLR